MALPAFVLLTAIEMISYRLHPDDDKLGYTAKDTATSFLMWLGSQVFGLLWGILPAFAYSVIYSITPLRVPIVWQTVVLIVVALDLLYYWQHRSHHVIRVLWASHSVHHSSQRFNFSTAARTPWTAFTYWPFYTPLVALGVHPVAVAFGNAVNLVYQFWLHTERIGKLPRPVEFLFTTPSHHRVHHASQGSYLDRNFGGIFIIWDRIFGSFVEESERPVYGLTKNINTYNPFRVAVHEYVNIWRDLRAVNGWRERSLVLLASPAWRPSRTQEESFRDDIAPGALTRRPRRSKGTVGLRTNRDSNGPAEHRPRCRVRDGQHAPGTPSTPPTQ